MAEPLVLLPGLMGDARVFAPQINSLSRERAVMIAPVTQGERVEEIASNLIDQLPQRFALAGLGLGGIVAMEILRRVPDRVARLCLMGTNPLAETPAEAAAREPLIVRARAGRLEDVMREALPPEALAPGPGRMAVLGQIASMAADLGPEVFVRQSRALQRRRDQQSTLRKFKVPTLILCGAHDRLAPVKRHSFMAELMQQAWLEVIEEAGHLPPLEAPEATTAALRHWLQAPRPGL
ncbi:alpha/beta fold hydrolase [Pseudodonghicola flavimaris]|uniref:Alpha/beta hydrolase n=1 Tax=Pseudodonghicola flavimaris TaxID=3050036 RepID=A0ABT7EUP4_9RHOB|nr:alpha/beta hydrolase [Pseudodonghicola flavimaris]MDK3016067.1 alpha/beta hydrolase [Pseudodonghicola flavimaris]